MPIGKPAELEIGLIAQRFVQLIEDALGAGADANCEFEGRNSKACFIFGLRKVVRAAPPKGALAASRVRLGPSMQRQPERSPERPGSLSALSFDFFFAPFWRRDSVFVSFVR